MTTDEAIREAKKTVKRLNRAKELSKKEDERIVEEMLEAEKKKQSEILTTLISYSEELEKALQDMVFAYQNKDEDCPHDFEIEALTNAKKLLKKEGK